MIIKFNYFDREYLSIKNEVDKAINRVLKSGWFILGKELEEFEIDFANYCGVKYAVGVANGTEAIALALMAIDIKPGDEVITVSHTAVPTIIGIIMAGARPVFVDIEEDNYLINADKIENAITEKTKAILPVHLYGQLCSMDKIMQISQKYNIPVVEDCAQAHGASFKGKLSGSFGLVSAFSFYPTKNLGAYGDAGIITTNNHEIYEKIKKLRNYGQSKRYYHNMFGINSRLDEIQAAILKVKLKHLDDWNNKRILIANKYIQNLEGYVKIPKIRNDFKDVYHLFVIRTNKRNNLMSFLKSKGIPTLIHYPIPVHKQRFYNYQTKKLPITEKVAKSIISIPISPFLNEKEIDYIISNIIKFFK